MRRAVILFSGGIPLTVAEGVIQAIAGDNIDDGPLILARRRNPFEVRDFVVDKMLTFIVRLDAWQREDHGYVELPSHMFRSL